jgi:hypothetical protein
MLVNVASMYTANFVSNLEASHTPAMNVWLLFMLSSIRRLPGCQAEQRRCHTRNKTVWHLVCGGIVH